LSTDGRMGATQAGFPRALFVATHKHGGDCPVMAHQGYIAVFTDPLAQDQRDKIEEAIWAMVPDVTKFVYMARVSSERLAQCPHAGMSPPLVDPSRAVWVGLSTTADAVHLAHFKDVVEPVCPYTAVGYMHLGGDTAHVDLEVLDVLERDEHQRLGVHIQSLELVSGVSDMPGSRGRFTVYVSRDTTAEAVREALISIGLFPEPPQE
jgi:hypothetical protein